MKNFTSFSSIILVAFASLFASNTSAQALTFQDFLAQFPKAELPYEFNADQLQGQIEGKAAKTATLGWEYYQFLPELERSAEFSNMPVHPQPVASFETNEHYAVVYNIARGVGRGKTYSISVFNKQGAHIGTHFVAGVNTQTMTTVKINETLTAAVTEYKLNWVKLAEGKKVINGITFSEAQDIQLTTTGNPDQVEWATRNPENTVFDIAKMK
jgi:hypothetical protein